MYTHTHTHNALTIHSLKSNLHIYIFKLDTLKKNYSLNLLNFFKVSGCNQFTLATFNKKIYVGSQSTKFVYLNVANIH